MNFFDTAIAYQGGTSEQYLGRALKDLARREDVVVATKFLPRTPEEIAAGVTGQEHIQKSLDQSLQNLGMDYVDLYIYHMWDYHTPPGGGHGGAAQRGKGGESPVHRHLQLLCLAAVQGKRPGGTEGASPSLCPSRGTTISSSGRRSGRWPPSAGRRISP